jgi:ankyrin repeat protein
LKLTNVLLLTGSLVLPSAALAQDDAVDTSSELIDAVLEGNARNVTRLLEGGADPNVRTDGGSPLVSQVARRGGADIIAAFVKAGADLEAKDRAGATALMYAAQYGHNDVVNALVAAGANVNAKDSLGWTPLIRAVVGGNAAGVTALLAAGADKNAEDFFGRNAAEIAEGRDREDVIAAVAGN